MAPTVILLHTLEDGSWHWDWMVSRVEEVGDDFDARVLMTFRVDEPFFEGVCEEFRGVRLADHRARYLTFQGELGRGLGRVERVCEGFGEILEDKNGVVVIRTRFGDVERVWRGEREGGGAEEVWRFRVCGGG